MKKEDRNRLIEEYGRGFDTMNAALAEIPREAWEFRPHGEWSVHEIVVHMADSETMGMIRLEKLIAEPGSTLMPYAESRWAEVLDYQDQDTDDAWHMFKLVRQRTYRLLKSMPDQVFTHSVIHPEYDEGYTFEKWLEIYTRHISEHTEQLKRTDQARKLQQQKMS